MPTKRNIESDMFGQPIRKKTINGKRKGNKNERDACKSMELWVGVPFVRSPQSGALRWNDNSKVISDIVPDKKGFVFPLIVETKHLKDIPIKEILSVNSKVYKIWQQVMDDAIRGQKLPFALLRCNGMCTFVKNETRYQDYYVVMDSRYGGMFASLHIPLIFKTGEGPYPLIGFMFSELVERLSYKNLSAFIKNTGTLEKFRKTHGKRTQQA